MAEFVVAPPDPPVYAPDFLASRGLSAHALIAPDGTLIRCVPDDRVAYHARGHNAGSLGVELLVPGRHDYASFVATIQTTWVTPAAWSAAVELVAAWRAHWGVPLDAVLRHSDVDPTRKVDPGSGFRWRDFVAAVS